MHSISNHIILHLPFYPIYVGFANNFRSWIFEPLSSLRFDWIPISVAKVVSMIWLKIKLLGLRYLPMFEALSF